MKALQVLSLLFCLSSVCPAPNGYFSRDEQQTIENMMRSRLAPVAHDVQDDRDEIDELTREKIALARKHGLLKDDVLKNGKEYQLIRKSAVAIVRRLAMPAPPQLDLLIDKAVEFVLRKTMSGEYAKVRSGIKELVDKMLSSNPHKEGAELHVLKRTKLREEKILMAAEEILQELAIKMNLTTLQIKGVVNIVVDVLAKELGIKPSRKDELHERLTSHLRSRLDVMDQDNKDKRLRRLEESIEIDLETYKLSAEQTKKLEALMVEVEALKEHLTKKERLRMLKRVYADVKSDEREEKLEKNAKPPKLTWISLASINHLIRQKAIEMEMSKDELKVLGLAILTAVEERSTPVSATITTQETQNTKAPTTSRNTPSIPTTKTHEPTNVKTLIRLTTTLLKTTEVTKPTKHTTKKITSNSTTMEIVTTTSDVRVFDEKKDLESPSTTVRISEPTKPTTQAQEKTSQRTPTSTHAQTITSTGAITGTGKSTTKVAEHDKNDSMGEETGRTIDDELEAKLAEDEAELEGKGDAKKTKMDDETRAEELELELERKSKDKEKQAPTSSVTTTTTRHVHSTRPTQATEPSANEVTQGVTQTTKKNKGTKRSVTSTLTKVTQVPKPIDPELSKQREEEDHLEGLETRPTTGHITEVTQHHTGVVTVAREDFAKQLDKIDIHSRRNHELLQDETESEMKDLLTKEHKADPETLEDELKLAETMHKTATKEKTLEEQLHEITARQPVYESLEDEMKDLNTG